MPRTMSRSSSLTSLSATPPKYRGPVSPQSSLYSSSLTPLTSTPSLSPSSRHGVDRGSESEEEEEPIEEKPFEVLRRLRIASQTQMGEDMEPEPMELEPCTMDDGMEIDMGYGMDSDEVSREPEALAEDEEGEIELGTPSPPPRRITRHRVRTPSDSPDPPINPQPTRVEPIPEDDEVRSAELAAKARELITSLPFKHHFKPMDNPHAMAGAHMVVRRQPLDVDMWEIAMSPEEYGRRFSTVLASVELACHATAVPMGRNGHAPEFKSWILLGKNNHHLWVHPDIKSAFFDELCKRRIIFESTSPLIATYGSPVIPMSEFVRCLIKARCTTLWIKVYGQKLAIGRGPLDEEPAQSTHPKAIHNQWDLGVNFKSSNIWLFGNAATNKSLTTFPMLIPASLDLGSVMGEIEHEGTPYGFKVYPRLVHTIKAFRSKLQGDIPKTLRGIKYKTQAALSIVQFLGTVKPEEIGGFRIEVTVGAPTLAEARDKVLATPFFDSGFWLNPPEPYTAYKLKATLVTKDGLLGNADWVYRQHTLANPFVGTANAKPTKVQVKIMTDVLASFGWNGGKRRPTKSLAGKAWWIVTEPEQTAQTKILADLQAQYTSAAAKVKLVEHVRRHCGKIMPCIRYPNDSDHRYIFASKKPPFRLRCPECKSHLTGTEAMKWIAEMIATGRVPMVAARLDPEPDDDARHWERGQARQDSIPYGAE